MSNLMNKHNAVSSIQHISLWKTYSITELDKVSKPNDCFEQQNGNGARSFLFLVVILFRKL